MRYLTQSLANNTVELEVLGEIEAGKIDEAVGALEFELDARTLVLDELLREAPDSDLVRAKRRAIECHLSAIKKHRAEADHADADPKIAAMVREALARATDCPCEGGA